MRDAVPPYETTGGAEQVRDAGTAPPPGSRRPEQAGPPPTTGPLIPPPFRGPAGRRSHGPADTLDAEAPRELPPH